MKIALVSEHASPLATVGGEDSGGQNVHVAALAGHLVARGHSVDVFTRRDDPGAPGIVQVAPGYRVVHVDAGPPLPIPKDSLFGHMDEFADALCRHWRVNRPDVAHAHFWMSAYATQRSATQLGIPFAVTFHALGVVKQRHQGPGDTSPPERVEMERQTANAADRIIATCSDEVFELRRMQVTSPIDIVPCGVDLGRFTPGGPAWPRGRRKRIVSVARLVPRKGLLDVVRALSELPDAELLIAGGSTDESYALSLGAAARDLGLADRVRLLGSVSRAAMPELLRSAHVVVHTPWYEPFGIVPLEAMACGRAVVASAVGGLPDTVVDGRTGLHVPPRDPAAIAAAVRTLLEQGALRERMGRAGEMRARRRYGWDRVAGSTELSYLGILRRTHRRAVEVLR